MIKSRVKSFWNHVRDKLKENMFVSYAFGWQCIQVFCEWQEEKKGEVFEEVGSYIGSLGAWRSWPGVWVLF